MTKVNNRKRVNPLIKAASAAIWRAVLADSGRYVMAVTWANMAASWLPF